MLNVNLMEPVSIWFLFVWNDAYSKIVDAIPHIKLLYEQKQDYKWNPELKTKQQQEQSTWNNNWFVC